MSDDGDIWRFDDPVESFGPPQSTPSFDEIIALFDGPCSAHLEICELVPACGECGVKEGEPCVSHVTGKVTKIPHVKRITAARKAGW